MPLQPNSEIVLTIEKPVAGGRCSRATTARSFSSPARSRRTCRARVERISKQLAFAHATEVLEASPDRRGVGSRLGVRRFAIRAHCVRAPATAQGRARGRCVWADRQDGSGRAGAGSARQPSTAIACARAFTPETADSGSFGKALTSCAIAAQTRQLLPVTIDALERLEHALNAGASLAVTSCEIPRTFRATERAVLLELESSHQAPIHFDAVEGITGLLFADHESAHLTAAYGSPYVTDRSRVFGASIP